jgi:carbon storage regulator
VLILSRKLNESIVIDGRITVKVLRVEGEVVKLGIAAPPDVPVHRQELYEEIQRSNQQALTRDRATAPALPRVARLSPPPLHPPAPPFSKPNPQ